LLIPYDEGGRLAELHAVAGDLRRTETADGVRIVARLPAAVASRYERYALSRALIG
jgi:GTP-binding protein HflX